MCDTFIADFSDKTGYKIFGKNSDREPNEAQAIVRYPRTKTSSAVLQVTYINVPQVAETYEVILSKPFQMWGAEMGVNEHGVVIGNEAVFTHVKFIKKNVGLTGMDLLRLALERSDAAAAAISIITDLLELYGQDACGGYNDKKFYYHNSFIIADKQEQYILETAGRHWVAKRVNGYAAISNGLFIGDDYDLCSNSVKLLEKKGRINFAATFRDKMMSYFARCDFRRNLNEKEGNKESPGPFEAMRIMSSHGENTPFVSSDANMKALCIHASGIFTPHQTTGSMVVQIRKNAPVTVWLSGTSAPCISLYTPLYFGGKSIAGDGLHLPGAVADDSLWWKGERLHRAVLRDYQGIGGNFREERNSVQLELVEKDKRMIESQANVVEMDKFSQDAMLLHVTLLDKWYNEAVGNLPATYPGSLWYKIFRKSLDKRALLND